MATPHALRAVIASLLVFAFPVFNEFIHIKDSDTIAFLSSAIILSAPDIGMASSTDVHKMVWKEDGTLEEKRGGIVHDGSEEPQLLFARDGKEFIPLTYNHDQIVGGTRGIRELFVEEEVCKKTGCNVQILIGSQPLGLKVLSAEEGELTVDKPVETIFLYASNTLSCKYKGEQWYWIYSEGRVIMRKELSSQLPTEFKFVPKK